MLYISMIIISKKKTKKNNKNALATHARARPWNSRRWLISTNGSSWPLFPCILPRHTYIEVRRLCETLYGGRCGARGSAWPCWARPRRVARWAWPRCVAGQLKKSFRRLPRVPRLLYFYFFLLCFLARFFVVHLFLLSSSVNFPFLLFYFYFLSFLSSVFFVFPISRRRRLAMFLFGVACFLLLSVHPSFVYSFPPLLICAFCLDSLAAMAFFRRKKSTSSRSVSVRPQLRSSAVSLVLNKKKKRR